MHLLAATPGRISDGSEAVDLGQDPAEVVVLSAADTDLRLLSTARRVLAGQGVALPSLRLANLLDLQHPMSVDLYVESVIAHARLVVVRLLGGRGYWSYGVEQVLAAVARSGAQVVWLPGDANPDAELTRLSSVPADVQHRLWLYLMFGGPANGAGFLRYAASLLGGADDWTAPAPMVPAGPYRPPGICSDSETEAAEGRPRALVVFYRALYQAADLAPVDALLAALEARGLAAEGLFVTSLKDPLVLATLEARLARRPPDVILNATGFASRPPGRPGVGALGEADCPVLQVLFSGGGEAAWRAGAHGLPARDIAMKVALPEVDGRILARAVAFKGPAGRDDACQVELAGLGPVADRIAYTTDLAAAWARLRRTPAAQRRLALVLANYPDREGRIANGVGLDTPASAVGVLRALGGAGYAVGQPPADGADLIALLTEGARTVLLPRAAYRAWLARLPESVPARVGARWGRPEDDPSFDKALDGFVLRVVEFGQVAVGIQPPRSRGGDPVAAYHDPEIPPTHGYMAFYAWLRQGFGVHAVVHMGKHGTLEWLPGKALALSEDCFPEALLGPTPHLYPFIVNDPGEGTQAKRRTGAVIIDHLTPPLTRAESYGPLKDLEALVDEYYEAAGSDPRRLAVLTEEILSLSRTIGLDRDLGIEPEEDALSALGKLDNHLCELKEMQIRDGLHVFGQAPEGDRRTDLLVALARVPPADGLSLHRALADDLGLAFDPLDCPLGEPWTGPRPAVLESLVAAPWRSTGDTVERLEALARALVAGDLAPDPAWTNTTRALGWLSGTLAPAVEACGAAEMAGLLSGLDGRFVPPGPSGAPTRGRPDVLPTGRNFYSVDSRVVPTPAAWRLGFKSATRLLERHLQDHGDWPRAVVLTAWGTANMRSGGDDIAQALALLGVQPTWDTLSRRVSGFEVLPHGVLGRPRIDVILRISGFFRDAFPGLVDLMDSAVRAVAALDEPPEVNPIRARVVADAAAEQAAGADPEAATRRAACRVFGARPGTYGAGLEALLDGGGWADPAELARAYVAWGGHAYGAGLDGVAAEGLFARRLASADTVLKSQDNAEHDLLDSAEYAPFSGGAAAAVEHYSGSAPTTYHADHSRPDSPRIRTLKEEIARVVRGRAANPKWIAGARRHGYRGAAEMAATVDYLTAFAAAASGTVDDHHFEQLFDAYLGDPETRAFLAEANPAALAEMAARFREAIARGLWQPRRNATPGLLDGLLPDRL
ncbi:cobaltochelatase subunit CobN [Roseospirillum parvum]|uniref:Cobaltochelatase subunit CobN n=1 Tax=Roseospirillum parvum TaxID=83401 RepID=A0A1G7Z7N0_9PROT|nr:cobaltochelatase subunit CobN [Roseospirillum parvum]SDH04617.1 cobaltochelatase CobN [Roseospirillum parvum]